MIIVMKVEYACLGAVVLKMLWAQEHNLFCTTPTSKLLYFGGVSACNNLLYIAKSSVEATVRREVAAFIPLVHDITEVGNKKRVSNNIENVPNSTDTEV